MCTAVTLMTKDHYFGRTFDWEVSYGEKIAVTPRNVPLYFRQKPTLQHHLALLGIAVVTENTALYYDAINETGLGMAGLNFPEHADYKEMAEGKDNITPFELIPWILGQCKTMAEARRLLERINLVNISFSKQYPLSPLHWILTDGRETLTIESVREGLKIYENPVGVLTNNPPFPMQLFYLSHFMQLTREEPRNSFAEGLSLRPYSRGMGAMGLPGDLSSASRFVRTAFVKGNSMCGTSEGESVSQFFHVLGAAEQQRGCVQLGQDIYEVSIYTSCCNLDRGKYYYKTYDNSTVYCVDMHRENLEGRELIVYELQRETEIRYQN